MSTLTYVYADSTAVLGPLSRQTEPHSYDLCRDHAERLTVPRGWRIIRVPVTERPGDEISALADVVREDPSPKQRIAGTHETPAGQTPGSRHLRIVRTTDDS